MASPSEGAISASRPEAVAPRSVVVPRLAVAPRSVVAPRPEVGVAVQCTGFPHTPRRPDCSCTKDPAVRWAVREVQVKAGPANTDHPHRRGPLASECTVGRLDRWERRCEIDLPKAAEQAGLQPWVMRSPDRPYPSGLALRMQRPRLFSSSRRGPVKPVPNSSIAPRSLPTQTHLRPSSQTCCR
jgi:hypothetical protein